MRYKNTYITIEKSLFEDLESSINKHNLHYAKDDSNKIMMDKAVFFIDYIRYQRSFRKDEVTSGGYIRIPSKFLNIYLQKELRKHKDFLVHHNYIKTIPYSKDESKSYGYLVSFSGTKKSNEESLEEYSAYEFLSQTYETYLSRSLEKHAKIEHKKSVADKSTKHLTKWLNAECIQINRERAITFIDHSKDLSKEQKTSYSYSVNKIWFGCWHYLRSTNDNRLHSNLTNLPSELRKFVSHKTQNLVSLDIKSSQPFLLAGVFNLILLEETEKVAYLKSGLRSQDVKNQFSSVMNSISLEPSVIAGLQHYINLVCNQDIYNFIASNLNSNFIEKLKDEKGYVDMVYSPTTNRKEEKHFKDLRGYCKVLTLEYMYSSVENTEKRLNEINQALPDAVNKFIYEFKYCKELEIPKRQGKKRRTKRQKEKIQKSKKLFAKFLQQLEAFIILDIITKALSKQNPKMFMATIHDSIIVPYGYENQVQSFIEEKFLDILCLKPEIKPEFW